MKGFRCYFIAEETAGTNAARMFSNASVQHSDGSTTDLKLVTKDGIDSEEAATYDLLGRQCDSTTKDVVIINGKKRIIK